MLATAYTMLVVWQAGTWKTVLCNHFEKGTCTRGSLAMRYCTLEGLVVHRCKFYLNRCLPSFQNLPEL